mgnify:CR=1 FL=1
MTLAFAALTSCSDDNSVDLSNRKFVRIDQSSVYLEIDETGRLKNLPQLPLLLMTWQAIPIS